MRHKNRVFLFGSKASMKEARRHAYNRWTDGTKRCAGRSDYSYITPRIVVLLFISVTTRGVIERVEL